METIDLGTTAAEPETKAEDTAAATTAAADTAADDPWGSFGTTKKDKKKKKGGFSWGDLDAEPTPEPAAEPVPEPVPEPAPEPAPAEDDWGFATTGKKKKGKKGKVRHTVISCILPQKIALTKCDGWRGHARFSRRYEMHGSIAQGVERVA